MASNRMILIYYGIFYPTTSLLDGARPAGPVGALIFTFALPLSSEGGVPGRLGELFDLFCLHT